MLLEMSGKVVKLEQLLMSTSSRDAKLMLVGMTCSFLHPFIINFLSLCRFEIEEGSSTKLLQNTSLSISRFEVSERFGISFNLKE